MDTTPKMWNEVDYYKNVEGQKALCREFSFPDFKQALQFVNKIGEVAEKANHHPDISIGWGFVSIWLTTHDSKTVTKKDHDLAEAIDQIP